MFKGDIFFIEKNIHGAWVVYGSIGIRQYYGYTKEQSKSKYLDEAKSTLFYNE